MGLLPQLDHFHGFVQELALAKDIVYFVALLQNAEKLF
jgi:hypothetical protein